MKGYIVHRLLKILIVGTLSLLLSTCASVTQLLDAMGVQKPTAQVAGVRITDVSFDEIDFLFDVEINNPNNIGIQLAAYDYRFIINDQDFLQGNQKSGLEIVKNGTSSLPVPVKIVFLDLYNLISSLKTQDSTLYKLSCGLSFDLPVLGAVRVPVSTSGQVPLIKLPAVSLKNVKVQNIGLSGADIALNIDVRNPNSLLLKLGTFNYNFDVGGTNWANGTSSQIHSVSPGGETIIQFPISLNFIEMGRNIFLLLTGSSDLNYHLTGDFNVGTSWPLLDNIPLKIDESGKVPLLK
jgi:LEA14-like dessication related protein